jgi:hypothetical protein
MSLECFTQEPGNRARYEHVYGYQRGQYYGAHDINELIYDNIQPMELSIKWYPTPSDHHRCTDWSRAVRKVTLNEPSRWRRYVTAGSPPDPSLTIDLNGDDHISNYHQVGSYVVPDPGYDNGRDKSVTSALNKLVANSSNWGENLGQARKTIDGLAKVVSRGARLLKAFKDRDFSYLYRGLSIRDAQKTLADLWLEYSYGWKPLASDIYHLNNAVQDYLKKPLPVMATATGSSSNEVSFLWENWFYHEGWSKSRHTTYLEANMVNPELALLNSAGLANPLAIAWELVPWSFVVDWFIPVGNTLQACTAGLGLEFTAGFTSSRTEDFLEMRRTTNFEGYGYGYDQPGRYQEKGFSFHRQCYASLPLPRLYANPTPYKTERAVNALALVRQLT